MKVAIVNLGCKVNRVESDTIALSYLSRGAQLCEVPDADTVIVNTCTVTGEAEKKTRKSIRRVLRDNAHAHVVVTGCAAAIDPEFFRSLDSRVVVVDKTDIPNDREGSQAQSSEELVRVGVEFPTRVAVKVQDGCNHSCTYCIVHVARGKAWSRSVEEVEHEVLMLAEAGVKEIVLTGIDLASYSYVGSDGRLRLGALVKRLLHGLESLGFDDVRLRISSVEPRSLDAEFIGVLAESEGRVCRHLHLPLQSGSSRVLKEMNRPYDRQAFAKIVDNLYQQVPSLSLTTDIIVGFPGETEADFADTLELARHCRFSKIHTFRYSKRAGTPAAERTDQIDPQIKDERAHTLMSLGDELRASFAQSLVGEEERIVVEQEGQGMTESYFKVRLGAEYAPGTVVTACIAGVGSDGLLHL